VLRSVARGLVAIVGAELLLAESRPRGARDDVAALRSGVDPLARVETEED
jgi:hypothetical protein